MPLPKNKNAGLKKSQYREKRSLAAICVHEAARVARAT